MDIFPPSLFSSASVWFTTLHAYQNVLPDDRQTCMQINEPKWDAWKVLPEAVRTGQVAFALAHDGLDMHEVGVCIFANSQMQACVCMQ